MVIKMSSIYIIFVNASSLIKYLPQMYTDLSNNNLLFNIVFEFHLCQSVAL